MAAEGLFVREPDSPSISALEQALLRHYGRAVPVNQHSMQQDTPDVLSIMARPFVKPPDSVQLHRHDSEALYD